MPNLQELRTSIFQSGEISPLVIATRASFALLQATFFFLFVRMRSWRFLFLGLICGGLWVGIRWLIREVAMMKLVELEAERLRRLRIERDKIRGSDKNPGLTKEDQESWGDNDEEEKKDR